MWILNKVNNGNQFHLLLDQSKYTVSRNTESGDLILADDSSISRQHAFIYPHKDHVTLLDCGSKYGTYINDDIESNVPIEKNKHIEIKDGFKIRFGRLNNIWRMDRSRIVTLTSTLSAAEKTTLKSDIEILNGRVVDNWSEECTHLTIFNLTVTVKVLQSLAYAIPIIKPQYWKQYIKSIKEKTKLPSYEDFLPNIVEPYLNKDTSFSVNIDRKRLFAGKLFVFMLKKHMMKFESIIKLGGGTCSSLDEKKTRKTSLVKPNTIVIVYNSSSQSEQNMGDINNVSDVLRGKNRRMIPDCEIGLAILHCSIIKFCNPLHKMESNFEISSLCMVPAPSTILAEHTPIDQSDRVKYDTIEVPETLESMDLPASILLVDTEPFARKPSSSQVKSTPKVIPESKKRKLSPTVNEENKETKKMAVGEEAKPHVEPSHFASIPIIQSSQYNLNSFLSKRKSSEHPTVANEPSFPKEPTQRKRAFNILLNDNDDGDDDLFHFHDEPVIKKCKPISDSDDEELFKFSSNIPSTSSATTRQIKKVPEENNIPSKHANSLIPIMSVKAVELSMDKWLIKSMKKELRIEDEVTTTKIKTEDTDIEDQNETQKWIKSINQGFVARYKEMSFATKTCDKSVVSDNGNTSDGVKNFKAFVKKRNNYNRTSIIKTAPMDISIQNVFAF